MFTIAEPIGKKCVFSVHWNDPENAHIRPAYNKHNQWEFDFDAKCKCLKRKTYTPSLVILFFSFQFIIAVSFCFGLLVFRHSGQFLYKKSTCIK